MKELPEWITMRWRYLKAWVRDGKPLWLWLFIFGILLIVPHAFPIEEPRGQILWSGILLQLVGLGTVVWGMDESRKFFDSPPIWKAAMQWLARARYIVAPPPRTNVVVTPGYRTFEAQGIGRRHFCIVRKLGGPRSRARSRNDKGSREHR